MSQNFILDGRHSFSCTIIDDPWINADRTQCPLLISNLLTNAAKYTHEGGEIELLVQQIDDDVEIRVRDSGIGIEEGDLDEIFEVFGQSKQPLDRPKGGMGLGLALSRRLAEWHGGSLQVQSGGRGMGSEFLLTLEAAHLPVDETVRELTPLDLMLDIIIVDDNVDTADALGLYYQIAGHSVRIAYRAQDALAMVQNRQPDVVISDIGLPDTDGYALVRKLIELDSMSRTAFIAVTGYGSDVDREKALTAGFDAHFSKPVDLRALDAALATLTLAKNRPLN